LKFKGFKNFAGLGLEPIPLTLSVSAVDSAWGVHVEDWPMARKAACLPKGTRISDYVTLGVLTATVPGDLIDAVLSDTGKQSQRYRQLPARLVVYYGATWVANAPLYQALVA
jgi:hypothetical protein